MSLNSFYRKSRTLIAGDIREIERNFIEAGNKRVIRKYKDNNDIYCVLRLYSDEAGLFNYYLKAAAGISYALQHNMIPVVDMQSKENIFYSTGQRKKSNIWEVFFEQPAAVSFAEIKDKKNVVVIENLHMPVSMMGMQLYEAQMPYWRILCSKYIRFSNEMKNEIEKYSRSFNARKKWLGVLARGTDYLSMGVGHAVQPDRSTLLAKVDEVKARHDCDGIFLATEDADILSWFQEKYRGKLLYFEQKRYSGKQDEKLGMQTDYKEYAIEMNKTYLAAVYYLSRCSCLIASNTGGTQGAYMMSEGFEYFYCWYLGTMGSTDPQSLDISKL